MFGIRYVSYQFYLTLLICSSNVLEIHPVDIEDSDAPSNSNFTLTSGNTNTDAAGNLCKYNHSTRTKASNGSSIGDEGRGISVTALVIASIGVFCNTALIIALLVDPLKLLRKGAWLTILNLAVADFIAAASNFVIIGSQTEFDAVHRPTLRTFRFFWMFGASASFMLLALLTAETYAIIKYPIRSRVILTSTKIALGCVATWIFAIPLGMSNIAYLYVTYEQGMRIFIVQIAVLELAAVVQVVLKVLIIHEVMKSRRDTEVLVTSEQRNNNKHREIAKTIVILNAVLITTAFPYFVAKQMEYLTKLGLLHGDSMLWRFSNYYEPIAMLNFAANPLLYSLRLPDYRRSLLALLGPLCRNKRLSQRLSSIGASMSQMSVRTSVRGEPEQTSTKL